MKDFNDYDIPDEERQEEKEDVDNTGDELLYDIHVTKEKIDYLSFVRQKAIQASRDQHDIWENVNEYTASEKIRDFISKYRDEILGVLNNIKSIRIEEDWEDYVRYYMMIIDTFIIRSQYAIHSYKSKLKRLEKRST
jgi:hypothetical protein